MSYKYNGTTLPLGWVRRAHVRKGSHYCSECVERHPTWYVDVIDVDTDFGHADVRGSYSYKTHEKALEDAFMIVQPDRR